MSAPLELARVTITKVLVEVGDEDTDILVKIECSTPDGDQVALVDSLGMIELGKDSLLQASRLDDDED